MGGRLSVFGPTSLRIPLISPPVCETQGKGVVDGSDSSDPMILSAQQDVTCNPRISTNVLQPTMVRLLLIMSYRPLAILANFIKKAHFCAIRMASRKGFFIFFN